MDPITGAVVAIVVWFVLAGSAGVLILLFAGLGEFIGGETGGFFGAIVGWVAAAGWAIFAVIQAILQIVHLIQLIIGG